MDLIITFIIAQQSHHSLEYSAKFREILIKIDAKFDEKTLKNSEFLQNFTKFCSNFEIEAVQRIANLVVLEKFNAEKCVFGCKNRLRCRRERAL